MDSQWNRLWDGLLYVLLAIATVGAVADVTEPLTSRLVTLAIAGLVAAWYWWMVIAHPAWVERVPLMLVYFAGLILGTAVLVARDPVYFIFSFILYIQPFMLLPTALTVPVVAVGALAVLAAAGGLTDSDQLPVNIGSFILNVGLTSMIGLFIRYLYTQGEQRKQTISELEQARGQLEASAAANAELQAQLLVRAREAGVLDERQRLAREIHDTLAQGLTGIVTQLEAAENALDGQQPADGDHAVREGVDVARPDEARRHVDVAKRLARESLAEARLSVQALRPALLESSHLPDAIANVAAAWSIASGVEAAMVTTGSPGPLHPEVEVTLLRAAQEALANVSKHAGAHRVGMTLSYMEDVVSLDVRDDGVGFEPSLIGEAATDGRSPGGDVLPTRPGSPREGDGSFRDGSFGLIAMRERISSLGGSLVIETSPGEGTVICASVPRTPSQAAR
jgi:signal transduction histidine kinase